MKTYAFCPISVEKVNEREARANAITSVLILLTFVITHNIFSIVFLTVDFFLRAARLSKFSLIAITSQNILKWLKVKNHLINAGPKILAARIGLILSGTILLSFLMAFNSIALVITVILGLFSFMEGVFGLCVACEIYPFIYGFLYSKKEIN